MPTTSSLAPIVIYAPARPFDFIAKWKEPDWKQCGVYLWSIEHRGAYLASYVGKVFGAKRSFQRRIWNEEYKDYWAKGRDRSVDVEAYLSGVRRELQHPPDGHLSRELAALMPVIRLWLIPLGSAIECLQVERWIVAQLCRQQHTKQFLANRNPDTYRPEPNWPVEIRASPTFRIHGLTA